MPRPEFLSRLSQAISFLFVCRDLLPFVTGNSFGHSPFSAGAFKPTRFFRYPSIFWWRRFGIDQLCFSRVPLPLRQFSPLEVPSRECCIRLTNQVPPSFHKMNIPILVGLPGVRSPPSLARFSPCMRPFKGVFFPLGPPVGPYWPFPPLYADFDFFCPAAIHTFL